MDRQIDVDIIDITLHDNLIYYLYYKKKKKKNFNSNN